MIINETNGLCFKLVGNAYTVTGYQKQWAPVEVIIPSTYNGKPVTAIGERAFSMDCFVQRVVVGSNVVRIERRAFADCRSLTKIELGNVQFIEQGAFAGSKVCNVVIPKSVKQIGPYAFNAMARAVVTFENPCYWYWVDKPDAVEGRLAPITPKEPEKTGRLLYGSSCWWIRRDTPSSKWG
ncbi:MAG: leucine-rich repeat domain-containing protein [Clostridiales bacterium]|nr:leucine-rich repeat domain-containing protein [Clostridiales bacterium]